MSQDVWQDVPRCPKMSQDVLETSRLNAHGVGEPGMPAPQSSSDRVPLTRADVMTAAEVAEFLQIPVSTVYYLARRGELPASRLGRT
jgi:excisionase family DNA binding protein